MKGLAKLSLLLLLLLPVLAKAGKSTCPVDTIDTWRVYYNGVEVNSGNGFLECIINLNITDIKPTDTLSVHYYCDAPCSGCNYFLLVQTDKHHPVARSTMAPEGHLLELPMADIIKFIHTSGKTELLMFYSSTDDIRRSDSTLLARLKFN
jgi:hypothetical protein